MTKPRILVCAWLPEGLFEELSSTQADFTWLDGRTPEGLGQHLASAEIAYGLPPIERLGEAAGLRWIQLISAGVPADLCPAALERQIRVTNLAGLYGPTIAEHAVTLMSFLARNLHLAFRNQQQKRWDRTVAHTMTDLAGHTVAVVGLGNIGRSIARLARAHGMRVIGCRRRPGDVPEADRVYPLSELHAMLGEADYVAVAAPLTRRTEGMLGEAEFAAMKPGVIYVNVSRGPIAKEEALLGALREGRVRAAGLDVFAVEPLAEGHPFWEMPQVFVSPHYSGETVNQSARPAERLVRNLAAWKAGAPLEGVVNLEEGY
jgi:D-2-hydroxyacid dehydrogenase (NADP+)